MRIDIITIVLGVLFLAGTEIHAAERDVALTGRELFERLVRLEEGQKMLLQRFEQVDKRFEELREDMNKRFEQVDKRFEQEDKRFEELREDMNKRFEQVDQRFEQMIALMIGIVSAFVAVVAVSIGFAVWDRRTMIRPFETKVQQIEKNLDRLTPLEESLAANHSQLKTLLEALRNLARSDGRLAEVLKAFALL